MEDEELYNLFEEALRENEEDCLPNEEIPTLYGGTNGRWIWKWLFDLQGIISR